MALRQPFQKGHLVATAVLALLAIASLQWLDGSASARSVASCLPATPARPGSNTTTPLTDPPRQHSPESPDEISLNTCRPMSSKYPPLLPVCMNTSTLVPPPQALLVNTPFNITFLAKDAKGRPVGVGGSTYYALLEGPALIVGRIWEKPSGDLSLEFSTPLPGHYTLYLTLLYDRLDHLLDRWENHCNFNPGDIGMCLTSCHNSGQWAVPTVHSNPAYDACMDVCREYYGGPKFRGDEVVLGGITVTGQQTLLTETTPVCGIDVAPDQAGYWIDSSLACGQARDPKCLRKILLCPDALYSRPKHLCNSRLMWRPRTCRHVLWRGGSEQLNSTAGLPKARALYLAKMSNQLVMCGDSTTRELHDITKEFHPELNETYEANREVCKEHRGSVLFMGGCGNHGADANNQRMPIMLANCHKEAKEIDTTQRKYVFFRTTPAVHPWNILSKEMQGYPDIPPFHGQRLWLTNQRIRTFNTEVQSILRSEGVLHHVLDEYAITEPLRHWQLDSLHWFGRDLSRFVVETVINSFVSCLAYLAAHAG